MQIKIWCTVKWVLVVGLYFSNMFYFYTRRYGYLKFIRFTRCRMCAINPFSDTVLFSRCFRCVCAVFLASQRAANNCLLSYLFTWQKLIWEPAVRQALCKTPLCPWGAHSPGRETENTARVVPWGKCNDGHEDTGEHRGGMLLSNTWPRARHTAGAQTQGTSSERGCWAGHQMQGHSHTSCQGPSSPFNYYKMGVSRNSGSTHSFLPDG